MSLCFRRFFALFIAIAIVFSCSKSGSDPSENNNPPNTTDQYCQADTITIRDTFAGTHSSSLSGAVNLSYTNLQGIGVQVIIPTVFNPQNQCFRSYQIALFGHNSANQDTSTLVLYLGQKRPAAGNYTAVDVEFSTEWPTGIAAVFLLTESNGDAVYLVSDGGTINITASSDQNLNGNFNIQASGYRIVVGNPNQQAVNNVNVSGSFQLIRAAGDAISLGEKIWWENRILPE